MTKARIGNPLIVALDVSDVEVAESLAARLAGAVGMVKVGLELFTAGGPDAMRRVAAHAPVFLDLKLHDIPTTVRRAAANAGRLGARMLTVHALGGPEMVRAAVAGSVQGAEEAGLDPPVVVGVTVLSSLAEQAGASPASLAFEAQTSGAGAVVVSGDDVGVVREALGPDLAIVVPGVRPEGQPANDHARVLTPREALEAGADYLVMGRPITAASDPEAAARSVVRGIG